MFITIITGQNIESGRIHTAAIESEIALEKEDIKETMYEQGWLVVAVFNEPLPEPDKVYS